MCGLMSDLAKVWSYMTPNVPTETRCHYTKKKHSVFDVCPIEAFIGGCILISHKPLKKTHGFYV